MNDRKNRTEARLAKDPDYVVKIRTYTGKETYLDQIVTSLITVLSVFFLAVVIAVPLGITVGLSKTLNNAINPVIQIFKLVSPLAWLPWWSVLCSQQ